MKKYKDMNPIIFWSWFNRRKELLNRGVLIVPKHIFQMPCGCKKKPRDLWLFRLFFENGKWVHHCPHNARGVGTPMVFPEKVPQAERRKSLPNLLDQPDFSADDL